MATKIKTRKYVYFFGGGKADGNESMKNLLGGKGANLAEMAGHPKLQSVLISTRTIKHTQNP